MRAIRNAGLSSQLEDLGDSSGIANILDLALAQKR